jgi:REP element-mobilizing transposase RayT
MPQSFVSLHHHIIFSTKDCAPLLLAQIQPSVFEYVGGILRQVKCSLIAAGGMPDHVHLLISLSKEISVTETLRLIKTNSSKWIHDTFSEYRQFAWQAGYGAFAVSYSNIARVKTYISQQEEHHQKRTFQEEFIDFLKRHHVEYDERYLWD